jgi:arabinan endo-1,5-alpha-L-arabinosidase
MIKEGCKYYLFCTGFGVSVFSSTDMKNWRREMPVFSNLPEWVSKSLPGYRGNSIWAPDISYHNGQYYLYYAVSSFGKNTSCIGVAVNKTLDSASKDFKWVDKGDVLQSIPGRDLWNAIDPNLSFDENSIPWLVLGSFWDGIKLVRLAPDLISIAQPQQWYTLAKRPRDFQRLILLQAMMLLKALLFLKRINTITCLCRGTIVAEVRKVITKLL